jgi:DNA-binding MarR family transcriptional regulator
MLYTPTESSSTLRVWSLLLRVHGVNTQLLNGRLQAAYGLSINDYETLSALSQAPGQRLKRVDLARALLISSSGVTRLLDGLQDAGLVDRTASDADLRVAYAQLTAAGAAMLESASGDYVDSIAMLLETHLTTDELEQLADLLGKLSDLEA